MATRYIGIDNVSPKLQGDQVVGAASGGTLTGSQDVQVVFDDAVFGATPEGKQRLLAALDIIRVRIAAAKAWPISSSS